MARLHANAVSGTVTLAGAGTTAMSSAALALLPVVSAPDTLLLVIDPLGTAGDPEAVWVTAHTSSATTATITRAAESGGGFGAARAHTAVAWVHATSVLDTPAVGVVGDVVASAPADTAAAGSTGRYADAGHRHAREASGTTGTVYFTNLGAALSQSFTSEVDLTGLTAITFTADGTSRYRLHLHCGVKGLNTTFKLYEGSTLIGLVSRTTSDITVDGFWEWVPTAGSHTYKLRGVSASGTGYLDTFQTGGQDTFVSVEKIGTV